MFCCGELSLVGTEIYNHREHCLPNALENTVLVEVASDE
jgi:hypothetical protein